MMRCLPRPSPLAAMPLTGLVALSGCARNPSFSILGSYFPSWAFCIVVASFLTLLVRWVLRRFDWEYQLAPLVLIYPSLALLLCLSFWLVLFGVR